MRVLQINATDAGSTGTIMNMISDRLINDGNESYTAIGFCDKSVKSNKSNLYHKIVIGNTIDHKMHALLCRLFGCQGHYSYFSTKHFIKRIDSIQPDIVHIHNAHNNYLNYPLLFRELLNKNISVVITMHDCWWFTGKCTHYLPYNCFKWKDKCNHCPCKHKEQNSLFFDLSNKAFNTKKTTLLSNPNIVFVGCSNWISDMMHLSFLKNHRIVTINNGIDLSVFNNAFSVKDDNSFIILGTTAKWLVDENRSLLFHVDKWLTGKGKLLLIGSNKEIDVELKNTLFIGSVAHNSMTTVFGKSDVFANPTRADTYPTINMEAISCGIPVVTYDVGGSGETVVDGVTGYVVNLDDIYTFIDRINLVYLNGKQKYSEDCYNYAHNYFSHDDMTNRYVDLYKQILSQR